MSVWPQTLPRAQKSVTDFFVHNIFDSGKDLPEARELIVGSRKKKVQSGLQRLSRYEPPPVPPEFCGISDFKPVMSPAASPNAK